MGKNDLTHKISNLSTISLEIKDTDYYLDRELDLDTLKFDFNFNIEFINNDELEIFIHYLFSVKMDVKELVPIYHADHILLIKFNKAKKEKIYEVEFIANLLAKAILMTKGYYDNITKGYNINKFRLPIFNSVELINLKYKDLIKDNKISITKAKNKRDKLKFGRH